MGNLQTTCGALACSLSRQYYCFCFFPCVWVTVKYDKAPSWQTYRAFLRIDRQGQRWQACVFPSRWGNCVRIRGVQRHTKRWWAVFCCVIMSCDQWYFSWNDIALHAQYLVTLNTFLWMSLPHTCKFYKWLNICVSHAVMHVKSCH